MEVLEKLIPAFLGATSQEMLRTLICNDNYDFNLLQIWLFFFSPLNQIKVKLFYRVNKSRLSSSFSQLILLDLLTFCPSVR